MRTLERRRRAPCARDWSRVTSLPLAFAVVFSCMACQLERVPMTTEIVGPGAAEGPLLTSLQAGLPTAGPPTESPFRGNAYALDEGKRYYSWFNCAGCHGAIGGGSMGPPLADSEWIYGGAPVQVRDSILRGRPNGMPAFEGRLPEDVVWKLVAYVESLGPSNEGMPGGSSDAPPDPTGHPEKGTGERAFE